MPFDLEFGLRRIRIRHSRSKAGMRACSVVVHGPGFERLSDVCLVEGNHEVQTLSACTADQTLAKCVCWGRLVWSFQYSQTQRFQRLIQLTGVDAITVVNNEAVSFLAGNAFAKLLQRPVSGRMSGNVKVKDAPGSNFHDDECIDQLECRRHDDEEI